MENKQHTVDIHIIGGFLGSGKTTLINRLLTDLPKETKAAIIINEFGEVSIDGMVVHNEGYSMMEITGGCICCTLKGKLIEGLVEIIRNEQPEEIYIEATGMAVPWDMRESIEYELPRCLPPVEANIRQVIVCVDALQYQKVIDFLVIYQRQFEGSPGLVFTKQDLYEPAIIEEVERDIKLRYPRQKGSEGEKVQELQVEQITFTALKGPPLLTVTNLIEANIDRIIRSKGVVEDQRGSRFLVQYDGTRIVVERLELPGEGTSSTPGNSLILFCHPESRDQLSSVFSPLYSG